MFKPIEIDLDRELEDKNPKRVLPQIDRQVVRERNGLIVEIPATALLAALALGIGGFHPAARVFFGVLAVVGIGRILDHVKWFRFQRAKANAIRARINTCQQDGGVKR